MMREGEKSRRGYQSRQDEFGQAPSAKDSETKRHHL
jgi:hypothetical protein